MARILNDLGYHTRSGAHFSDMAIDRLLKDTTAKGTRNEVGIQVKVDPIVSVDVWARAARLLSVREGKQPAMAGPLLKWRIYEHSFKIE